METLRLMVKSVVVIIIMAAFLEMILPRSDMKRYINLIIGMFVIIAVLNPFLAMFHQGFSFDVLEPAGQGAATDTGALIRQGQEMAAAQKTDAARQYKEKLAKQVTALAGIYRNTPVEVSVDLVEDSTQPDFGAVKKIVIHISPQSAEKDTVPSGENVAEIGEINVDQVNINSGGLQAGSPTDIRDGSYLPGLRAMIANFYGLTLEQVEIKK